MAALAGHLGHGQGPNGAWRHGLTVPQPIKALAWRFGPRCAPATWIRGWWRHPSTPLGLMGPCSLQAARTEGQGDLGCSPGHDLSSTGARAPRGGAR